MGYMALLVLPSDQYKSSFIQAVHEYQSEELPYYLTLDPTSLAQDFQTYTEQLAAEAQGEHLPEGFVPHTTYWLVENDEFIGRVDIRHEGHIAYDIRPTQRRKGYGKLALELAKQKAQELGLTEVLITCDVNNIGSNKIIQGAGGVLQETKTQGGGKPDTVLYQIKLA